MTVATKRERREEARWTQEKTEIVAAVVVVKWESRGREKTKGKQMKLEAILRCRESERSGKTEMTVKMR